MVKVNQKYFDKHGEKIVEGMTLKHDDGELELVYKADDGELGFNATNENWQGFDGSKREIYGLFQFNLAEWEIVK